MRGQSDVQHQNLSRNLQETASIGIFLQHESGMMDKFDQSTDGTTGRAESKLVID